MNRQPALILPRALLLDMDGTLTEPVLDFPAIKLEMGIGGAPILEAMAKMDVERRRAAQAVLDRHEELAAAQSTLGRGSRDLLDWSRRRGVRTAIVTRNCRQNVETVLRRHGLAFDALVTRDDGPFKPDPAAVLLACQKLGVAATESWMVGDGQHDIEAGEAAGARTVWVSLDRTTPHFAARPWRVVRDLAELFEWVSGDNAWAFGPGR